ncbi:MAG: hypothetical protein M5U34_03230 [Chloroflexi bacterium]|nr:hypothetical protein [Chloroflexota bacterium]
MLNQRLKEPPLVLWFVGGLALSRILYEGFFPSLLWLGRPLFALPFAIIISTAGSRFWRRRNLPLSALLPLLLNLLYLFDPTIDLVASRFIFFLQPSGWRRCCWRTPWPLMPPGAGWAFSLCWRRCCPFTC